MIQQGNDEYPTFDPITAPRNWDQELAQTNVCTTIQVM